MTSYTSNLYIEVEDREYEIEVTASIENDSIGKYEYWGSICYDNQPDYLGQIEEFKVLGKATEEELKAIQSYIYDNESNLIEQLSDKWIDR